MNQKSTYSLNKSKKGYVLYDFIFALVIFIMIFFFTYITFADYQKELEVKNIITNLNSDASDTCYLLTKTYGVPNNWETLPSFNSTTNRIGLRDTDTSISFTKLDKFNQTSFSDIMRSFNQRKHNLHIQIRTLDDSIVYLKKGAPSGVDSVYSGTSICYGYLKSESKNVKILIEVWK